ncbi:MAG: GNAT family N-acetyltransferase [Candidatus Babeliales bacterium]|nr:GNAT family N-acetyltransferase [Candidatus Babeliales bacterium]
MNAVKTSLFKKIIFAMSVVLTISCCVYFFVIPKSDLEIKNYSDARDREFIFDGFKKDEYWLVTYLGFPVDFMLNTMSPRPNDPEYYGKLNIRVLLLKDKPVGFVTYYKKKFYEAQIQFLYVDGQYRGKGYAKKLIDYVCADLKKQGISIVKLVTYTNNFAALKLYKKIGFKESYRDEKLVYFEKELK